MNWQNCWDLKSEDEDRGGLQNQFKLAGSSFVLHASERTLYNYSSMLAGEKSCLNECIRAGLDRWR
jgi:hypothetical protein